MSEFDARRHIVEIGRRIWQRGYVAANDGNLSVRMAGDRILVTPTGRSKGFLEPDDLVIVDRRGRKLSGRLEATSELAMHLFVYERRPDVSAVVHAHPPKATGFAVAGVPLAECILPEVILTLGQVPLASYATPSTPEVSSSIEKFIATHNAMLLKNHGALALGSDIYEAYYRMETIEHFAEIMLAARALGETAPLSRDEVTKLLRVREKLGLGAQGDSEDAAQVCVWGGDGDDSAARSDAGGASTLTADEEAIVRAVIEEIERAERSG